MVRYQLAATYYVPFASFKSVHATLQISRAPPLLSLRLPPTAAAMRVTQFWGSSINYKRVHQFDTLTYCSRRCCWKPRRHVRRKMFRVPVTECLFENERETNRLSPLRNKQYFCRFHQWFWNTWIGAVTSGAYGSSVVKMYIEIRWLF